MASDTSEGSGADERANAAPLIICGAFLLSLGYAVLRYHILGPVPWKDFPLYTLNKGVCLAAFLLLTLNFSLGPYKSLGGAVAVSWLNARKALGMTGFLFVCTDSCADELFTVSPRGIRQVLYA
jgi:hypothetical protein